MTIQVAEVDDIEDAFRAGLQADAARSAGDPAPGPDIPPPPRRARDDPEAPHGRDADGTPLAPYGHKADGTPKIKPGGPGRKPANAPRIIDEDTTPPPAAADIPGAAKEYVGDLMGVGTAAWLGLSAVRGGQIWRIKLPDLRPYAAVLHQSTPDLAAAWAMGAAANPTVRRHVRKLSGDGSYAWVFAVGATTLGFAGMCAQVAQLPAEERNAIAEKNDVMVQQFMQDSMNEVLDAVAQVTEAAA